MVKKHLKSIATPRTWPILRKEKVFVARPQPGAHPLDHSIPLVVLMRDMMGLATTRKETRHILHNNEVLIDMKRRISHRSSAGLFDTISIPQTKQSYRISLNKKGKLSLIDIKENEANLKLCKITGKKKLAKGKTQLNLFDGRNILVEKDTYKVGDTILIELPSQKIKDHVPLQKQTLVFLTAGKHIGEVGELQDIFQNKIIYKNADGKNVETLKAYAFVIGKDKPLAQVVSETESKQ